MKIGRRSHLVAVPNDWDEQAHQAQESLAASEPVCTHVGTLHTHVETCECGHELIRYSSVPDGDDFWQEFR